MGQLMNLACTTRPVSPRALTEPECTFYAQELWTTGGRAIRDAADKGERLGSVTYAQSPERRSIGLFLLLPYLRYVSCLVSPHPTKRCW